MMSILSIIAFGVFIVSGVSYFNVKYSTLKKGEIITVINNNVEKIDTLTRSMEQKASDLAIGGSTFYLMNKESAIGDVSEKVMKYLQDSFSVFPSAIGGGIWFDEYMFDPNRKYFGPYVFWKDGRVQRTWDLSHPEYDYPHQDWYTFILPGEWDRERKREKKYYWSAPYRDEAGSQSLMTTIGAFITDGNDKIIGISTVDWALDDMLAILENIKVTPHSSSFLIESTSKKIMSFTSDQSMVMENADRDNHLPDIIEMSSKGSILEQNLFYNGEDTKVYSTITDNGMVYGFIVPERDLLDLQQLRFRFFIVLSIIFITIIIAFSLREHMARNRQLLSIFRAIPDGVILFSEHYEILANNRKADQLLDAITRKSDINSFSEILFALENGERQSLIQILEENDNSLDLVIVKMSDLVQPMWFALSAEPFNPDSDATKVVVVIRDITKQMEQENNLMQARKMDAVGQLASGIAHDFNNILAGIIGAADLLQLSAKDDQKEMLNLIENSAEKAARLTRELLSFSRKAPGDLATVNVNRIVEKTAALLRRTINKNITLETSSESINPHVIGNDTLIQNSLINMGINAAHAMPGGGIITLRTRNRDLDEIYCKHSEFAISPGKYIDIEVRDTGCGMCEEVRTHIFEPFFTTKEVGKGTGLGMSTVYNMVIKHKGAVTVYSEPGEGTSFHILLPNDQSQVKEKRKKARTIQTGKGKVLVVDDEEVIRITAREMLLSLGYTVFTASNGDEAWELLKNLTVDVILLDMIMPGMNGRDFFIKLKDEGIPAQVILCSGFSKQKDVELMENMGLFGFLQKPYQRSELSVIVASAISHSI